MREIKFRAWDGKEMIHDWLRAVKMPAQAACGCELPAYWNPGFSTQTAYEVMQFTGLNDRNGVEIYEGDILRTKFNGRFIHGVMEWDCERARFSEFLPFDRWEVVGNIHENHELLEDAK